MNWRLPIAYALPLLLLIVAIGSWIIFNPYDTRPVKPCAPRTLDLDDLAGIDVAESIVLQRVIELEKRVERMEKRRD